MGEIKPSSFLAEVSRRPTTVQDARETEPLLLLLDDRRSLSLPEYFPQFEDGHPSLTLTQVKLKGAEKIAQQTPAHLGVFCGKGIHECNRSDTRHETRKQGIETGRGEAQVQHLCQSLCGQVRAYSSAPTPFLVGFFLLHLKPWQKRGNRFIAPEAGDFFDQVCFLGQVSTIGRNGNAPGPTALPFDCHTERAQTLRDLLLLHSNTEKICHPSCLYGDLG